MQFVWQPVAKDERQVNNIMYNLLRSHQTQKQNLDLPFDQIQQEVQKANEAIAKNNAKIIEENKLLPEGSRRLTQEMLAVTQEQYDAFKKRFLTKGTPETLPQNVAAAAAPTGGEAGGGSGEMPAAAGGH